MVKRATIRMFLLLKFNSDYGSLTTTQFNISNLFCQPGFLKILSKSQERRHLAFVKKIW